LVATGRADFAPPDALQTRAERLSGAAGVHRVQQYLAAEEKAAPLLSQLDPGEDGQTSASEALYLSNNAAVQSLVSAEPLTLAARLAALKDQRQMAESAVRAVLCRPPAAGEVDRLTAWMAQQQLAGPPPEPARLCEQLIWALVASAEFRFQH
jgi:hypothetical protein